MLIFPEERVFVRSTGTVNKYSLYGSWKEYPKGWKDSRLGEQGLDDRGWGVLVLICRGQVLTRDLAASVCWISPSRDLGKHWSS